MRYIFLIASHINVEIRVETLRRALASIVLANPDHIYLSYCVDESYKTSCTCAASSEMTCKDKHSEFETIWKKEMDMLNRENIHIPYTILYQQERKLQFEHYNILKDYVQDDDIVSFSDDDDLTHKDKVNILKKYFSNQESNMKLDLLVHGISMFGTWQELNENSIDDVHKDKIKGGKHEYTCYNIRGKLYKDWFNNCEKYTEKTFEEQIREVGGMVDIVFLHSMMNTNLAQNVIKIPDKLYHYRVSLGAIRKCYNR